MLAAHHSWGLEAVPLAEHQRSRIPPERGWRLWADVTGGVCFAILVGKLVTAAGYSIFVDGGWSSAIGWETVWLATAMLCSLVLPLGIRHRTDLRSTLEGLRLDWPELVITLVVLHSALQTGLPNGVLAPVTMVFAIGAAEEFVFRVLLLGWLVTRLRVEQALLVSAAVFGLAHLHELSLVGIMSIVPQFTGGIVLGAVYLRTRNIIGPILAHAFWDLPYFLAYGVGISGGGTEGGMPSVTSFWEFWLWVGFGVYGLWLVRPGVDVAVRDDDDPVLPEHHGTVLVPGH